MGPADVEGWFTELGLTPSERAEREGIASWDLVLDGRRRFDAAGHGHPRPGPGAVICWAHYAPPIGDMFRKSYRKLLRWNDEFPFAKFSVGEDERPLLAVELPIAGAERRRARPGDRPDPRRSPTSCSRSRRTGCGSAAGSPTRVTGRRRKAAFLDRYAGRLAELAGLPERAVASRPRHDAGRCASLPGPARRRAGERPAGRTGGRAARSRRGAGSDDRRATRATTSSRRSPRPGHVDLLLTNHLKDTVTRRYYFDRAFLAVLPDTSGFKLTWDGKGTPTVHVSKRTKDYTLLRLDLGQRLFSGKSARYRLRFDLVDPGGAPTRDVRVGESLVTFPVWAFATDGTPGSTVKVVFPADFSVEVEAGSIPGPGRRRHRPDDLPDRQARPAARVLRLPRRRSAGRLHRTDRVPGGRRLAGRPHDPLVAGRPDWSTRVGDLFGRAPAAPGRADRPPLADGPAA